MVAVDAGRAALCAARGRRVRAPRAHGRAARAPRARLPRAARAARLRRVRPLTLYLNQSLREEFNIQDFSIFRSYVNTNCIHRDSAFPSLDAVLRQLNDPEAPTLFRLLEQQAALEKRVREAEDNVVRFHFYTHFPTKYCKYENF